MNFTERASKERDSSHPIYFMPHHAVLRGDSMTTKLRVVFDASSHEQAATPLNEHLEKGPCLFSDLVRLLIKFQAYRIASTADIEKVFLQINVKEVDRDALRFIWFRTLPSNEEPAPEMEEWRMKRVPFGTRDSLLNATLQHHLNTIKGPQLWTASLLANSFYVDDLLVGAETEEEAGQIFFESSNILEACGMKLRK
nr:uncharacterized protein LOC119176788 [Rhipicephalus microplus]